MTTTIKRLHELQHYLNGAVEAAENDQPALSYALLSCVQDQIYTTLNALKMQSAATWHGAAEAAE